MNKEKTAPYDCDTDCGIVKQANGSTFLEVREKTFFKLDATKSATDLVGIHYIALANLLNLSAYTIDITDCGSAHKISFKSGGEFAFYVNDHNEVTSASGSEIVVARDESGVMVVSRSDYPTSSNA